MKTVKTYSSTEILRILKKNGWTIKNQEGSHAQLTHPVKSGKVTVPHPRKDLDPKTVRSIFKQAGILMKE
ncbi:predicted periplasmic or secreted lipoprotein [Pelotomaculum thermopropionicum SI]|uniref:Predicted periplasmic or secreted lipoprotein n=1 Tax=Pelotomaculum thermopropionicum (strain DSM 13744 / JCM 10971 / SI) TaxID=370438 RepID=A5D3R3_PELTS|nr:predicted periplasmic or secreted lipoprotein [Pelotomaculum thermopropionicum SI]